MTMGDCVTAGATSCAEHSISLRGRDCCCYATGNDKWVVTMRQCGVVDSLGGCDIIHISVLHVKCIVSVALEGEGCADPIAHLQYLLS